MKSLRNLALVLSIMLGVVITSSVGVAQVATDNFERASLGTDWNAHPDYNIQNGDLHNGSSLSSWNFLATYGGITNPNRMTIEWAPWPDCDLEGATAGGFAFMLSGFSYQASGYFIYIHSSNRLYLYEISNGNLVSSSFINRTTINGAVPEPGQEMELQFKSDAGGHHFSVWANGEYKGTVTDPDKLHDYGTYYCGVMLYGNAANNVESISASLIVDNTPPSAISDLNAVSSTSTSVTITWTAPGDDGMDGTATMYDVRYNTAPITDSNFATSFQASGVAAPSAAGSQEILTVGGLIPNSLYYFAIKTVDDADNWSSISNVPSRSTEAQQGLTCSTDDFNRATLGPNWAADPDYFIDDTGSGGELSINPTATPGWSHLAVYLPFKNPKEVSLKWSETGSNTEGVVTGGLAVMLDAASPSANGYLILRKASELQLYLLNAGVVGDKISWDRSLNQSKPSPGDDIKVEISSDDTGHHFTFYKNGLEDGTLIDNVKYFGAGQWYTGVMLYPGFANNIDNFTPCGIPTERRLEKFWGDGQSGPVLTRLPDSIAVRAVDDFGNPIPDIVVDFQVSPPGSGFLGTDSIPFNGNLWKEVEDGTIVSPMQINTDDPQASNDTYTTVPIVSGNYGRGASNLPFYVPVEASYKVWFRLICPSGSSNSLYYQWDAGDTTTYNLRTSFSNWEWKSDGKQVLLSKGFHKLSLINREPGVLFDKVLVTYTTQTPSGKGDTTPPFPNVTDDNGIASTFLTFGSKAGEVQVIGAANDADGEPLINSPQTFFEYAEPGPAVELQKVSGDSLTGAAGAELGQPQVVQVVDQYGNGVEGFSVTFTILQGGGTFTETQQPTATLSTDQDGYAMVHWKLGYEETQRMRASAQGLLGSPVPFVAFPGSIPYEMKYVSGDDQTGPAGDPLPEFLVIEILDEIMAPVSNYPVEFEVTGGGGTISAPTPLLRAIGDRPISKIKNASQVEGLDGQDWTEVPVDAATIVYINTDQDGKAFATWTLGDVAGPNTCEARAHVQVNPVIEFSATGVPGPAAILEKVSGDGQSGPVGLPLTDPFIVKVTDAKGNGIANHQVDFEVTAGTNAHLGDQQTAMSVLTDEAGLAQIILTMGSEVGEANTVQVVAMDDGVHLTGSPMTFTATAGPGVGSNIEKVSGDEQVALVGTALPNAIVVRVTDIFGNPTNNHKVTFEVIAGGGNLSGLTTRDVFTNAQGLAQVNWTLGPVAGTKKQIVEVTSIGYNDSLLNGSGLKFYATGTPSTAAKLEKVSGDGQQGQVGSELPEPLRARVTDTFGNAISNYSVTYAIQQGSGLTVGSLRSLSQQGTNLVVVTDTAGIAEVYLTLGPAPGADNNVVQVEARSGGSHLVGSPFQFKASGTVGDAQEIVEEAGSGQIGTVGQLLPSPLIIRVVDSYGNPVQGYYVTFEVSENGGTVNGKLVENIPTGADGKAQVNWQLGTTAGVHTVTVSATNLDNSPIVFEATAEPDNPYGLQEISGNSQTGTVGEELPEPFKVKVIDQFGNGIVGHLVDFTITQGGDQGASIDDANQVTKTTDTDGFVEATLKLGDVPGTLNYVVEVSSKYNDVALNNSPITFAASARVDMPHKIELASAQFDSGVVNLPLAKFFKVKVSDKFGNPIGGHAVEWEVMKGEGNFGGGLDSTVTYTNSEGVTQIKLTLGPVAGVRNNVVEARATYEGTPLLNSPITFYATAKSSDARNIDYFDGNGQTGTVGQPLARQLKVKITDINGNSVQGHPVRYTIKTGFFGSFLVDGDTLKIADVESDNDGIAGVTLLLGERAGSNNNRVDASSSDGVNDLNGSPVSFTASGTPDITDADRSQISADSPIPADGDTKSPVVVTLFDKFGNPVPNKAVILSAPGYQVSIDQPLNPTDSNGRAQGYVYSTKARRVEIQARDINNQITLSQKAVVVFTAGSAARIAKTDTGNGDGQMGNVGTALPESLRIIVTDKFFNPIPDFPVNFSSSQGDGEVLTSQPSFTDSSGIAGAIVRLGPKAGANIFEAQATGLQGSPVRFTLIAQAVQPASIVIADGDGQMGQVGKRLQQPLCVQVLDGEGRAVWGAIVRFKPLVGGGSVESPVDTTDLNGMACTFAYLGNDVGDNLFHASVDGISLGVTFTAKGSSGSAIRVEEVSGNDQSGTVGRTLPNPLVVSAVDQFGNGVVGVLVQFTVKVGQDATLDAGQHNVTKTTNAQGQALATLTLATKAGLNMVEATSSGLQGAVQFRATGRAGDAYAVDYALKSGNNQTGTVGRKLLEPIAVKVTDKYGNVKSGVNIRFVVTDGGGSIDPEVAYSDAQGIAKSYWTLGPTAGAQNNAALAMNSNLQGSPVRFVASGDANHYPTLVFSSNDTTIYEQQLLEFPVAAMDEDQGDVVSLQAVRVPGGATFIGGLFSWRPTYEDAGEHHAVFQASDQRGGVGRDSVKVTVLNTNRAPIITEYQPVVPLYNANYGETITFSVDATDPDEDQLFYKWYVDGIQRSSFPEFELYTLNYHQGGPYVVLCEVSDADTAVTHTWELVITAVELESFTAESVPFEGIQLEWKTTFEENNLGFNLLRSRKPDEGYVKINSEMIASDPDKTYEFTDTMPAVGRTYYYKVEDISVNGRKTQHESISVTVAVPKTFDLWENFPNPFNPDTKIRFQLPKAAEVRLEVYNIMGQKVRTLVDARKEPGYYTLIWDSRNDDGVRVASGIYLYRIQAGRFSATKKMALIR